MAAAELKLQVGLDLAFFRQQLAQLGNVAVGYQMPINIKFDRASIQQELLRLSRINTVISINDSQVTGAVGRIETLNKSLTALRDAAKTPIVIETKYKATGDVPGARTKAKSAVNTAVKGQSLVDNASRTELQSLYKFAREGNLQFEKLKNGASSATTELKRVLGPAFSNIGSDVLAGIKSGLADSNSALSKIAAGMGTTLISQTKAVFGIASPSKVFKAIGANIVDGLEIGLQDFDALKTKMIGKMREFAAAIRQEAKIGAIGIGGLLSPIARPQGAATKTIPGVPSPMAGVSSDPGRGNQKILNSLSLLTGDPALYRKRMSNVGAERLPSSLLGAAQSQFSLESLAPSFKQARLASKVSPLDKIIDEAFFGRGTLPKAQSALSSLSNSLERLGTATRAAMPSGILQDASGNARMKAFGGVDPSQTMGIFPSTGKTPTPAPGGSFLQFSQRATAISAGSQQAQAPSMPPSMAPPLSGQSTKFASPLGAGYFEVGKGLNAIKTAYDQTKTFLNSPKFPVTGAISGLGGEFGNAVKQVLLFGTAYKALAFLTSLPGEAFEAAKALATYKNQLQAVTAQSQTFDKSLAFVDNLAARFNVPLDSARQGFVKLYASMEPAGFKQGQIENLFTGISKAAAAFGLSSDKVDRVNYAFAQMASKGQIMSEELKGQLGDVLPGALGLFAEAAQMTIPEFSKAMEDGAFKGKAMGQVLDNVSILLNNKFSKAASGAAKTLQGAVNQIQNNLKLMYESFTPIVNGAAAAFGPQINGLIKDITATMKVLTSTFIGAGNGFNTLSPRAQAFYTAIKTLKPSLEQAGAAIVDLGGRLAQLIPALVQVLAATISFAASPLGRAALLAAVAIGTLTTSLAVLEATGIKAAIKSVYKFIGTLLAIPAATGAARVAIIGLKLAITGLVVGGILLGLDFLIDKLFKIGDAAQNSTTDLKGLVKQLDEMTATGDLEGLSKQYLDAEKKLAKARNDNAAALVKLRRAQQLPEGFVKTLKVKREQTAADTTLSSVLSAQRELQAAKTARANAIRLKDDADKKTEQESSKLQKIDLSGTDDKKQSLESYYSLQDTLAKNAANFAAAQTEEDFRHQIELLERYYDIKEARANAYQKDAMRFEREMVMIEARRQEAQLKAKLDVQRAQSSVAGGAPGSGAGGTGAIFGDTGRTFNAAGFVHGHFQNQDREALVKDTVEVVTGLLSKGVSPELGSGARFTAGMNAKQVEALVRKGIGSHKQYASGAGAIDIFVPKGTQVPVPVSGIKNLGGAAGVTGLLPRGSQLMHLDRASTMSASGGEMAPRKITGSEKRDAVAAQSTLQASIARVTKGRIADANAVQEQIVAFEKYRAAAFPTTEQDLQNKLLARRNELFRSGMTDERIDQEIKLYENQERGAAGLAVLDRLLAKKILTDTQHKTLTKELNQDIANQNNLLQQNATLVGQSKFDQALKGLRDQIDMARALTPEAEMRTRLQQQGYAGTQLETLFETEKAKVKAEELKTQMQGVASTIGDAFSTAFQGIINGSMSAQEALGNMFKSIGESFVKMAMDMIAKQLVMITLGFIMKALGLAGSAAGGGLSDLNAPQSINNPLGNPGTFFELPKVANGASFSNGIAKFATGGIVNGPTLFPFADGGAMQMGLMGEAGPEAIMPLQRGADGSLGVRAAMGGNGMGGSSSPILSMSFETSTINGVEYVSRDQLEAAMAQTRRQASSDGAKRGMAMTLDKIQQSPQTRRRIGM